MIHGPQTMNNSQFSQHIQCSIENCQLDCLVLSIIAWFYIILKEIKEKISKLLIKTAVVGLLFVP